MGTTWFEQGLEQGLERGLQRGKVEGQREAVVKILEARFGELNQAVRERVEHWPADKLEEFDQPCGTGAVAGGIGPVATGRAATTGCGRA